jgi:hypothetical protein
VKPDGFLDFTHLAPDNIEKGNGVLLPCRTVREDKVISSNHRFYPGQIVYSKIRPNLAKVVIVDFEGLCSADMYPIDALIDAFYLQRYMLSESFLVQAVKPQPVGGAEHVVRACGAAWHLWPMGGKTGSRAQRKDHRRSRGFAE